MIRLGHDLEGVGQIMIPRCVYGNLIGQPKCPLHGFGDASLKAYCAVVYYVCELSDNYHVELLTSKTRVALITSGRYDTEVINSARIFSCFFSILCRAARVVQEPAEETTTSGK